MRSQYFVIGNYDDLYRLDNGKNWNHYSNGWESDPHGPWLISKLHLVEQHCNDMKFQFREIEPDDIFLELI